MKNQQVLDKFIQGEPKAMNSTKNLYIKRLIDGTLLLINYKTIIAERGENGTILINPIKYSNTTSKHQNYLLRNGGLKSQCTDFKFWQA